jgi:hypothetical protein
MEGRAVIIDHLPSFVQRFFSSMTTRVIVIQDQNVAPSREKP